MLWRGGCSSVIFESVKGSWYQKVWESLPSSYWLLKIEILPNLLVNICCFEPVKWPSLLIPLAPPTYQHWRVTVWQTGLQDPRLHPHWHPWFLTLLPCLFNILNLTPTEKPTASPSELLWWPEVHANLFFTLCPLLPCFFLRHLCSLFERISWKQKWDFF